MKDVTLGRNLERDWPVLATRSTWAVAIVAVTNNLAPLVVSLKPGLRTVEGMGFFPEYLLMMLMTKVHLLTPHTLPYLMTNRWFHN